jgi:hypothetical protein
MLPAAMTEHTDDRREGEREAREHLIDAEVEAQRTLEEAERLEEEDATLSHEPQGSKDEEPPARTD